MTTTFIEVVDTAVKIGLGGLITLLGTLAVTKLNHSHDNSKETRKRFFDTLETVSADIEEITHVSLKYWAFVTELVRNQERGLELSENRKLEFEETKTELFYQFKSVTVSESKLMLLGLKEQAVLIREYGECLKDMRRNYHEFRKSVTEADMEKVRIELLAKRESLFTSLSCAYKNGL
ncbi:hypothetical protein [Vibrio sp. PID23_8]|uniref:hypothetical protein n=1 Tax=Vibrio sp. PID23_8 TaxID=1583767 RepID=UPI000E6A14C9|nr:hypothetical protein [Vibrio sp. PID23_8]RIZ55148.1 hypothetical protein AK966_07385 [Vibrio sp. PID23_8]